jgi:hypothetical protein
MMLQHAEKGSTAKAWYSVVSRELETSGIEDTLHRSSMGGYANTCAIIICEDIVQEPACPLIVLSVALLVGRSVQLVGFRKSDIERPGRMHSCYLRSG